MSNRIEAAAPRACGACPWRLRNQGTRHTGGWYTKANLRRLWNGLRVGERMTCHPTDARMNDDPGGGPDFVKAGTTAHECTGSLILVQREIMVWQQQFAKDTAAYRRARAAGLSKWGIAALISRVVFGGIPLLGDRLPMAKPDLGDPEIGYSPLAGWEAAFDRGEPS